MTNGTINDVVCIGGLLAFLGGFAVVLLLAGAAARLLRDINDALERTREEVAYGRLLHERHTKALEGIRYALEQARNLGKPESRR